MPLEGRRFNDLFGSSIKTDADLVKAKLENPERYFAEEQQKEQALALDEPKREVQDALPGARDIRDEGDRLLFTMPNGAKVEVQLSPSIEVSDTAAGRARAAHGIKPSAHVKINGRERTIGTTALVELSQLGRKGSAYHEVLHAVYDLCLTEKEKAALHRAFDKEAGPRCVRGYGGPVPRLDAGKTAWTRDTVRQTVAEGQGYGGFSAACTAPGGPCQRRFPQSGERRGMEATGTGSLYLCKI